MAVGYRYTLERQANGWWLVRFPDVPEALTEGETKSEARTNASDCLVAALEGYMKDGVRIPRPSPTRAAEERVALPSLVTAKLTVYETMRGLGWSKSKLARQLGVPENSVRRLLDLRHASHMRAIDEALAVMDTELAIELPRRRSTRKAA
jgi:antitoxin HicB